MKTWTFRDRTGWPAGPWDDEPDKAQWTDEATGLVCLIRRGQSGSLCGYVGVGPAHPFHGKAYNECVVGCGEDYCDHGVGWAHGGLTYSGPCQEGEPEHGICHVPEDGSTDAQWWFGFDCAHGGDLCPMWDQAVRALLGPAVYRDMAYVQGECAALAGQLGGL